MNKNYVILSTIMLLLAQTTQSAVSQYGKVCYVRNAPMGWPLKYWGIPALYPTAGTKVFEEIKNSIRYVCLYFDLPASTKDSITGTLQLAEDSLPWEINKIKIDGGFQYEFIITQKTRPSLVGYPDVFYPSIEPDYLAMNVLETSNADKYGVITRRVSYILKPYTKDMFNQAAFVQFSNGNK